MEQIEINEYVRTKAGEIAKIVDINMFDKTIYKDGQGAKYYLEDIVKHSFNLIDLIEENDYVNGYRVDSIDIYEGKRLLCNDYNLDDSVIVVRDKDIKTIVAHEQFSSLEYKVED